MQRFLKWFLIFIVGYHIIVTCIGYGVFGGKYPQIWPILRDSIRLGYIVYIGILWRVHLRTYFTKWKQLWIRTGILFIFALSISYLKEKSLYDMFVGIKYGLLYLPIFLSATFMGHLRAQREKNDRTASKIDNFFTRIKYFLVTILIGGFIRQIAKVIWPDLFLHIGYGPLDDFKFGEKPPIYYLTGYEGTQRRQGIFSWPNNYGYFLIAMLPLITVFFQTKREKLRTSRTTKPVMRNSIFIVLRLVAIGLSLSRTARIGGCVILALYNFQWIKHNKKIAIWISILALAGIIWLSELKGTSTLAHIQAKFGSIKYVIQKPNGYGLGTSWPAVHYNGTILPENYYIQLMLDIWTLGFLLRAMCLRQWQRINKSIQKRTNDKERMIYQLRRWLSMARIALLVMGLFLHVFEDSMVNYIFFILRWILSGYLLNGIKK